MLTWKIGCSGYHYADWKRLFYPEGLSQRKWFEYYCEKFNSLELNVTFYRFPKIEHLQSWYDRSPENFSFTVKAPRLITHYKRLTEAQDALNNFYDIAQKGLKEKLGCVLFQFPSSFVFEEHRLERIVNLLDHQVKNVVEFRHESWWRENVLQTFSQQHITFCGMSHPNLSDEIMRTTETIYYRFHGVPHLYWSRYQLPELEQVAHAIQDMEGIKEAYIYFNNTAEANAVTNAREFQELLETVSRER